MSLAHHPDRNPGDPAATAKFQEIGAAYAILKDPQKRAEYELNGLAADGGPGADGMHRDGVAAALNRLVDSMTTMHLTLRVGVIGTEGRGKVVTDEATIEGASGKVVWPQ
ncbi:MAG: hypothetical protein Q9217_005893 [Psora testacea]